MVQISLVVLAAFLVILQSAAVSVDQKTLPTFIPITNSQLVNLRLNKLKKHNEYRKKHNSSLLSANATLKQQLKPMTNCWQRPGSGFILLKQMLADMGKTYLRCGVLQT